MKRRNALERTVTRKAILVSSIVFAAMVTLGIALAVTLPDNAAGSGEAEIAKIKSSSLAEAKELVPETVDLERADDPMGESPDVVYFNMKDAGGNNIGVISSDRVTGEITYFYDCREQGPSANVNVSLDEAKDIACSFLTRKGMDLSAERMELCQSELVNKGMVGPPENPQPVYQYMFMYREAINGIPISDGSAMFVWISPEDGRIISFSIDAEPAKDRSLAVGKVNITQEQAIEIAKKAAKDLPYTPNHEPYISDDHLESFGRVQYADFGDGKYTPYYSFSLFFGESDLTCMIGATLQVDVLINAEDGDILYITSDPQEESLERVE